MKLLLQNFQENQALNKSISKTLFIKKSTVNEREMNGYNNSNINKFIKYHSLKYDARKVQD